MELELIRNPDAAQGDVYTIARAVYAECGASSLVAVEALCSMIANNVAQTGRRPIDVVGDASVFGACRPSSPRHCRMTDSASGRGFQMCLRVVRRMLRGDLDNVSHGAVRFHHADEMPAWAIARGYIADIDGMLFYL